MGGIRIFIFVFFYSKYEHLSLTMGKSFNFYFGEKNIRRVAHEDKDKRYNFRVGLIGSNQGLAFPTSPTLLEYHGFQTADGVQPMYSNSFKQVWGQLVHPDAKEGYQQWEKEHIEYGVRVYLPYFTNKVIDVNVPLLSLMNVRYIFSIFPIYDVEKKGLSLYLPGRQLKFIDNDTSTFFKTIKNSLMHYFYDETNLIVYKVNSVLPRSFIVSDWKLFEKEEELLSALRYASAAEHVKTTLFLKKDVESIALPEIPDSLQWSSKIVEYKPNRVVIQGASSKPSLLILTDNFHRHWKAKVNGNSAAILPAYYTFRAVQIPQGNFTVVFTYEDPKLMLAYALFPLGIFLLFGFLLRI